MTKFNKQAFNGYQFFGWLTCIMSGLLAILLILTRQYPPYTIATLIGFSIIVCPRTPLPTPLKMMAAIVVYLLL